MEEETDEMGYKKIHFINSLQAKEKKHIFRSQLLNKKSLLHYL